MSDDRQDPAEQQPDDQTRPISPPGGAPDETAPLNRTPGETAPLGSASGPSAAPAEPTAPLPPAQRSGPAWAGRAEVPAVRSGADPGQTDGEWYPEEQAGRPWWLPIVWGIVLLLLVGLLGVGIWLARQGLEEGGSTPESPRPTTPAATSASPSPSPTTRSPSPSPTSAAPVQLPVPPLVGLSEAAARSLLDQLALGHQVEYRPSDQPPGTVIAIDPEAGELVAAGDEIRLVVAAASPSPSATTAEPTNEPTTTASPSG
ncbi:PASTA domain-containing protein [Micromonospora sp. LOL_024]|uniref:PASTA domain-containing protein n=1 Tax=Micromonospora sp. LOL_024 TaxID=3345412 RepID=UPI003A8A3534